jgi:sorbitol-specific phosphotransferase system component IIBC
MRDDVNYYVDFDCFVGCKCSIQIERIDESIKVLNAVIECVGFVYEAKYPRNISCKVFVKFEDESDLSESELEDMYTFGVDIEDVYNVDSNDFSHNLSRLSAPYAG